MSVIFLWKIADNKLKKVQYCLLRSPNSLRWRSSDRENVRDETRDDNECTQGTVDTSTWDQWSFEDELTSSFQLRAVLEGLSFRVHEIFGTMEREIVSKEKSAVRLVTLFNLLLTWHSFFTVVANNVEFICDIFSESVVESQRMISCVRPSPLSSTG